MLKKILSCLKVDDIIHGHCVKMHPIHMANYFKYKNGIYNKYDLSMFNTLLHHNNVTYMFEMYDIHNNQCNKLFKVNCIESDYIQTNNNKYIQIYKSGYFKKITLNEIDHRTGNIKNNGTIDSIILRSDDGTIEKVTELNKYGSFESTALNYYYLK
jgi:hypothetical protein